jgi:uncharacterized protein
VREGILDGEPLEADQPDPYRGEASLRSEGERFTLSAEEGGRLVGIAREAIQNHLSGREPPEIDTQNPSALTEKRGVFVTLLESVDKELRGCIGAPYPDGPLLSQLSHVAVEAATEDPRFNPVSLAEFRHEIIVEVTVLTAPEAVRVSRPLDYRDKVKVGRDGLIVEAMGGRGLLLPQVAVEEGFDSEEFLSQCCLKAGLLPDAWLTGKVRVSSFQGQIFAEESPGGPIFEKKLE